ncbi:MAG: hypothetical protein IT167_07745 [Bryobacterales bacterium]|nr:hypothetical protein [Bryobacterales bacterium]
MAAPAYSLDAWRRFREQKERPEATASTAPVTALADVPADAEMDDGIVIGFWNGERFVSWEKWRATAPITVDPAPSSPALPDASIYRSDCGGTPVWLRKDGDRWLMFAGTQKSRRRDFASPFLEHAIRTAEAWYGPAADGWHPVERVVAQKEEVHADTAQ